jgi:ATP-dependent DNA ligase
VLNSIDLAELIDRRVLQAERDVARAERRLVLAERRAEQAEQAMAAAVAAARAELQSERERSLLLQMHLNQVYASTSWRVSRPIRVASRLVQALRNQSPPPLPSPLPASPAPPAKAPSLPPREHAILQRLQSGNRTDPVTCG